MYVKTKVLGSCLGLQGARRNALSRKQTKQKHALASYAAASCRNCNYCLTPSGRPARALAGRNTRVNTEHRTCGRSSRSATLVATEWWHHLWGKQPLLQTMAIRTMTLLVQLSTWVKVSYCNKFQLHFKFP